MEEDQTKLFPTQASSEEVFLLLRRHWFTYNIFWLLSIMLLIPLLVFLYFWAKYSADITVELNSLFIVITSVYLLSILGLLLYGFIDYYLDVYIVTDRRIVDIKQNGLFKRDISELHMQQVQDVNASVNGMFPTIFHYGEVHIQTAGEMENFIFYSVPDPYAVAKTIINLHEQHLQGLEPKIGIKIK